MVTVSGVPPESIRIVRPAAKPVVDSTLIVVSPALAGATSVFCVRWNTACVGDSSGFATLLISGAWLDTSCDARCVGVSRATRSAARSWYV